jgi:hypothetical protein
MPEVSSSPSLANVLRSTLERIERSAEVHPSDPAFVELKRSVTRAMAELEVTKSAKTEPDPPLLESS